MGASNLGCPAKIVLDLAKLGDVTVFVETGTFLGGTTRWAAKHFKDVYTIELSEQLYKVSSTALKKLGNVQPLLGDSREKLSEILASIVDRRAVHWLDGHWSGQGTSGSSNECPLLDEIKILTERINDIILIDDARLFLAAPPSPHNPEHWPTISEVVNVIMRGRDDRFIQIFDDVIFVVPNNEPMRDRLIQEAQQYQARSAALWPKVKMKLSMMMLPK